MEETAQRRWHNMVVAALADQTITEEERSYLEQMREYLGLSPEAAAAIEERAVSGKQDLDIDVSPLQQRQILRDVIRTAIAGGAIEEKERRIIERVAENIGMSREELDALIEICRSAVSVRHPPREKS